MWNLSLFDSELTWLLCMNSSFEHPSNVKLQYSIKCKMQIVNDDKTAADYEVCVRIVFSRPISNDGFSMNVGGGDKCKHKGNWHVSNTWISKVLGNCNNCNNCSNFRKSHEPPASHAHKSIKIPYSENFEWTFEHRLGTNQFAQFTCTFFCLALCILLVNS